MKPHVWCPVLFAFLAAHVLHPGGSYAQPECEEDLHRAAQVVYNYWSFSLYYPNRVDVERLYAQHRPDARAARIPDACADVLERFMAGLDDGHAVLEQYPGRTPRTRPPIALQSFRERYSEWGQLPAVRVYVVDRDSSASGLQEVVPGSELLRVNGLPVDTVYRRRHARISGSTLWWRDHIADKMLLLGTAESSVDLMLRHPDGSLHEVTVPRPPDPYDYDEERRKKALEDAADTVTVAASATLDGGWGYLRVYTFMAKGPRETTRAIDEALESLLERPGLILDMRDNHGGFIDAAAETAGRFIEDRTVIARMTQREPGSDRYAAAFFDPKRGVHTAPPVHAEPRKSIYEGPVVVLVDAGCFSACEMLAGGLKSIGRATLVGTGRTGGGSGTVTPYRLESGAIISFSMFVSWLPDGDNIEFDGIAPDVTVPEGPAHWVAGEDPALEKAIELLEGGTAPVLADAEVIEG